MKRSNIESSLKRFLKRKVTITMGMVVAFLITGTIGYGDGSITSSTNIEEDKIITLTETVESNNRFAGIINKDKEKIDINTIYGKNEVIIENGKVYMHESNCKEKICMKMGKISIAGDSIICLPNRLMVKIVSDKKNEDSLDLIIKWEIIEN